MLSTASFIGMLRGGQFHWVVFAILPYPIYPVYPLQGLVSRYE